jgi:hypothetical protein
MAAPQSCPCICSPVSQAPILPDVAHGMDADLPHPALCVGSAPPPMQCHACASLCIRHRLHRVAASFPRTGATPPVVAAPSPNSMAPRAPPITLVVSFLAAQRCRAPPQSCQASPTLRWATLLPRRAPHAAPTTPALSFPGSAPLHVTPPSLARSPHLRCVPSLHGEDHHR